jgi:DNA-binding NarL/FixJ family response regulator
MAALIEKSTGVGKTYTAYDAAKALEIVTQHRIHVAFIDARMPQVSGISLAKTILKEHTSIKVIGMTSYDEDDTIIEMLGSGLHGILLKRNTDRSEIDHCLQEVLGGRIYYTPEVQLRLGQHGYDLLKVTARFSKRETEILQLICQGQSSKQIAVSLQLQETTVEDYRKVMLQKSGTKNTAELVSFAHRNGLL